MAERYRARPQTARTRISNPVSGWQRHLIFLTMSRPSLVYIFTKVAQDPIHFVFMYKYNASRGRSDNSAQYHI